MGVWVIYLFYFILDDDQKLKIEPSNIYAVVVVVVVFVNYVHFC